MCFIPAAVTHTKYHLLGKLVRDLVPKTFIHTRSSEYPLSGPEFHAPGGSINCFAVQNSAGHLSLHLMSSGTMNLSLHLGPEEHCRLRDSLVGRPLNKESSLRPAMVTQVSTWRPHSFRQLFLTDWQFCSFENSMVSCPDDMDPVALLCFGA